MPSSSNKPQAETTVTDPLDLVTSRPTASYVLAPSEGGMYGSLSAEEQGLMMKSIQEIFELEEEPAKEDEEMADEGEEDEPVVDLEDQARRTERLKGVLSTLAQLWWSDSDHIDLVAEKLADGSRDRKWFFPVNLISPLSLGFSTS
jgi:hypothetical protein